ncbi:DUF1801 domain-containing protein [uncultured Draconibacterium sp.]|uniref:iron chaperone n=1 Tax=uncultured Draconibacterium sp. TaxID=1573823 RepID=UPI0032174120
MKYNATSIQDYINAVSDERGKIIVEIISLIKEYFPSAEGNLEYNMPTFPSICSVASQKHYISVYIYRVDLLDKHREELGNLKVGKSCIRFTSSEQMPGKVLRSIFAQIKNEKL